MNWLDIILIIVLGLATFSGFRRGLTQSLVILIGIVIGIFLAGRFQDSLADVLDFVGNDSIANVLAFGLILVATFLAAYIVGSILRNIVQVTFLGWADKIGGALFGLVTCWFISAAVIALFARYVALPVDLADIPAGGLDLDGIRRFVFNTIDDSAIASFQIDSFPIVLDLLPGDFDAVRDFFGS